MTGDTEQQAPEGRGTPEDTGSLEFMDEYISALGGIQGKKFAGLTDAHPMGLVAVLPRPAEVYPSA